MFFIYIIQYSIQNTFLDNNSLPYKPEIETESCLSQLYLETENLLSDRQYVNMLIFRSTG